MASMDKEIHKVEMSSMLLRSQAAERNKDYLLRVLQQELPESSSSENLFALEIASGTGQHVVHLAEHMPHVLWQPSECDHKSIQSIDGYIQISKVENALTPLRLDTTHPVDKWAGGALTPESCDLILCINMIHISEWAATEGLFRGAGHHLKKGGALVTYGPYKIHGCISPDSNVQFDQMLRHQCPDWGLRDTDELEKLAKENGLVLEKLVDMPANNKTLIFRKQAS